MFGIHIVAPVTLALVFLGTNIPGVEIHVGPAPAPLTKEQQLKTLSAKEAQNETGGTADKVTKDKDVRVKADDAQVTRLSDPVVANGSDVGQPHTHTGLFRSGRAKRDAELHPERLNKPRGRGKQRKSNQITPGRNKLDTVNTQDKKPWRIKLKRRRKQFDIQLPFPNREPWEGNLNENNSTNDTNDSDNAFEDTMYNSIGITGIDDMGQFTIIADGFDSQNQNKSRVRRVKRHRSGKKVRVPLPYNSSPEEAEILLAAEEGKTRHHGKGHRKHRKRKRLPPLH